MQENVEVLLGATIGLASWLLGFFNGGFEIATVVALAITTIVIVYSVLGMILPRVPQQLRVDPAMANSPLTASVMDILGMMIYFGIAAVIL